MYNARVIQILITSPSDVQQSIINKIFDYISKWNRLNSFTKKLILKPLRWETDVYSDVSNEGPQPVINTQLVKKSDIVIGVFWTRIGTPTQGYISGSVEEIERHIDEDKPAMLYFLKKTIPQEMLGKSDAKKQFNKLERARKRWEKRGICNELRDSKIQKIFDDLSLLLNDDSKLKKIIKNGDFHLDPIIEEAQQFEYNFLPTDDGKRIWIRQSVYRWVEKSPNSAIPDKVFLCYSESESIISGVKGMIVQCATKDEEIGFQVFIPEPGSKDMWLYCRIVNKRGSDWERLGVSPIRFF